MIQIPKITLPSFTNKILIALGAMILFCGLAFIIYRQEQLAKKQLEIQTSLVATQQLADNIIRSQSSYTTKDDLEKFISGNNVNLKAIQDNLSTLNAQLTSVNVVSIKTIPQTGTNVPSTSTGINNPNPNPANPDPYGYSKVEQKLTLNEKFDNNTQVPLADVSFKAWEQNPWNYNVYPRQYKVVNVIGTDENQRQYIYNKFTINSNNKDYDVKVSQSETQQIYPDAKMSWFNPRLFIGADGGFNATKVKGEFTPNVSVGIASYGRYKTTPDWSFLQIGVGYGLANQKPSVDISPAQFNIGKNIPLMNNTYVGPSAQISTNGDIIIGAGLRVGL